MPVNNPMLGGLDARLVGELVSEQPRRARLFARLQIDYCCGGQQTLAEACAKADLQLEAVVAALQTVDELETHADDRESTDWRDVGTAQLCEHIVSAHHDHLRDVFPRIDSLLATVVRVHGAEDTRLAQSQSAFESIRAALEPHLASEETELFPAIIAAERGGPAVPEEVLAGHEYEHTAVGAALLELRRLCDQYDRRHARCNTHRALLDALEDLELNLHQHVHEENNVLFVRARTTQRGGTGSAAAVAGAGPALLDREQPLPACCQGWVAEQGQRWARARRA